MRLIWALAIACVVAATGVRPEIQTRTDATADASAPIGGELRHLDRAPTPSSLVAIRATSAHAPDVRLPPFVLPASPTLATIVRNRTYVSFVQLDSALLSRPASQSARGPPSSLV